MAWLLKRHSVLPGFGLGLGVTVAWVTLLVVLPLSTLGVGAAAIGARKLPYRVVEEGVVTGEVWALSEEEAGEYVVAQAGESLEGAELLAPSWGERAKVAARGFFPEFWREVSSRRVWTSFRVTFGAALVAAVLDVLLGGVVAYALVRGRLPFRRVVDALVDLPFAMPTAVCGIAMAGLYAPGGPVGAVLERVGVRVAFTPAGIVMAMVFIGMPFVVRALQPALEGLGEEWEEAAESLGASRWETWRRVLIPELGPSLLTGFLLAFARGLGEYGTIIFIAGNAPFRTEIASLLIVTKLESFDYPGATVLALVMVLASFAAMAVFARIFGSRRAARRA